MGQCVFLFMPAEKTSKPRVLARPFHGPFFLEIGSNTARNHNKPQGGTHIGLDPKSEGLC